MADPKEPNAALSPQEKARREAAAAAQRTQVRPARLQSFEEPGAVAESANFTLIQDVPLEISVEVGRTRRPVREIVNVVSGSIIELDKLAGEPVDIIVNGQLIAHGEVVVVDENFGVRITEIINKNLRPR